MKVIPNDVALELVTATALLSDGPFQTAHFMWSRLSDCAEHDLAGVIRLAEKLVAAELSENYPHFPSDELTPLLRSGLRDGDRTTASSVRHIIDKLSEAGFLEYLNLLKEN